MEMTPEEDIQDALFVMKRYAVQPEEISRAAQEAINNSAKDTALFLFRQNVDLFLKNTL